MPQTDMLAKVASVKNPEQNHAEAFEMAMWDQNKISSILDVAELWTTMYDHQKQFQNAEQILHNHENNAVGTQPHCKTCGGCDNNQDGRPRTNCWQHSQHRVKHAIHVAGRITSKKFAFQKGKNKQHTIQSIEDDKVNIDNLIAYWFDPDTNTYISSNGCEEVEATLILFSSHPDPKKAKDITTTNTTRLRIYPNRRGNHMP